MVWTPQSAIPGLEERLRDNPKILRGRHSNRWSAASLGWSALICTDQKPQQTHVVATGSRNYSTTFLSYRFSQVCVINPVKNMMISSVCVLSKAYNEILNTSTSRLCLHPSIPPAVQSHDRVTHHHPRLLPVAFRRCSLYKPS